MELKQELKMHVGHMKLSLAALKNFRPRTYVLLGLILVVAAFLAGYAGGIRVGQSEADYREGSADAAWRSAEIDYESKGNFLFTERMRKHGIDNHVSSYVDRANDGAAKRAIRTLTYRVMFGLNIPEEKELGFTRLVAERRMKLPAPTAANIAEAERYGLVRPVHSLSDHYERIALAYSQVLGRPITAAQLVTDSDIQNYVQQEKDRRKSMGLSDLSAK